MMETPVIFILLIISCIITILCYKCEIQIVYYSFKDGDEKDKNISIFSSLYNYISNYKNKLRLSSVVCTNIFLLISISLLVKLFNEIDTQHDILFWLPISLILTFMIFMFMLILANRISPESNICPSAKKKIFFTFTYILFLPITFLISSITKVLSKPFLRKLNEPQVIYKSNLQVKPHPIFETTFYAKEIKEIEDTVIEDVLDFSSTIAKGVMTPLVDIISINCEDDIRTAVELIINNGYSRIPVYQERVDNIIGYIYSPELIYSTESSTVKDFIREAYYIPETKRVDDIFDEMHRKKVPIIFVVDEYGGTSGLITIFDIANVIINDILDEKIDVDIFQNQIIAHEIIINGNDDVDNLNNKFNLGIKKESFETIGGFITFYLGKIPKAGEKFQYNNVFYSIIEANDRTVLKVGIHKIDE